MSQHEFFSFQQAANPAENPPNFASAERFGDVWKLAASEWFSLFPATCRWTEFGWRRAGEVLARQPEVDAVLVSQTSAHSVSSEMFDDGWNWLPPRLASLALRPHALISVVARHGQSTQQALAVASAGDRFTLWRWLIEAAKCGTRLALLKSEFGEVLLEPALLEPNETSDLSHDDWRPQLTSSSPPRELRWLFQELEAASSSELCGQVVSPADGTAVLAGVWLLHGDADRSHRESQSIEDEGRHRSGNFWHGIMHRQEPDYDNSKYWFRRVGRHPIFGELARRADAVLAKAQSPHLPRWRSKLGLPGGWDAFGFVDWCESAARDGDPQVVEIARQIQFVEMHLLLRASYRDAVGADDPES